MEDDKEVVYLGVGRAEAGRIVLATFGKITASACFETCVSKRSKLQNNVDFSHSRMILYHATADLLVEN